MASSAYPSTPGTTYNNRICRVLLGPCSDQLRDVLRLHIPPGSFPNIIRQYKSNLPRLTATQRNLILPRTGNYSGDYSDMDISLLYLLLRNLCSTFIPEHVNGWGNSPDMMDFTVSANIERIREARNKMSHSSCTFLSHAKFNDIWSDIKRAVKSMDIHLMNRNKYEKEIDFLRTETMDPEQAQFYTEQLRKQVEDETRTLHKVIKIQESISDQEEVLRALDSKIQKTDTEVQSHKREIDKIKHQMQQPYTLPQQKGHFQAEVSHIAETLDDQVEILYSRCKQRPHAIPENLRQWIQSINESEADRIRILPLKEDDTIEVDRIYVPLYIVDEFEIHTSRTTDKKAISELTPDIMFNISPDKPASFIFMLGDAGYGKTVQCRRIAKSWCNAWKAENSQNDNDVKVIDSENTKKGKLHEWEKSLKDFEFLFYVPMRDVNNEKMNVREIIHDYYGRFDISQGHLEHLDDILNDPENKMYKCLIILDGLDEWNISESKRKLLTKKGIPNCEKMPYCTFLFTMRCWRFMEVDSICRRGIYDKVLLLHGLSNNGIEELATNILCNYYNLARDSQEFQEQFRNVRDKAFSSPGLQSLMRIPLLAVFCILTWHENICIGHSLTTFYLSMIEALIKRSPKREQIEQMGEELSVPKILKRFIYVTKCMPEISRLGELAFGDLTSQSTKFVLSDVQLRNTEVEETVDLFLKTGLLSKHDASGQIHENNVRFSFLHKTIQEFIYSLCLLHKRSEVDIVNFIVNEVADVKKALERSTVLSFVSGLSPAVGCNISNHIAALSSKDPDILKFREHFATETYNKVFHLYNLQLSCYREARGRKSIEHFKSNELNFSLPDIILLGNDADRLTIRETADILRYHANDIKSLCMKVIPDDREEGITNVELKTFLHESDSLEALCIDGYDRGKCRLLHDFGKRIPCLHTIGLSNVALTDNILADVLTKEESKKTISALGLFHIRSADDLEVNYQYQFSSVHRSYCARSGYIQKRKLCYENSHTQMKKKNNKVLLKDILNVLPVYQNLSVLHVSYMDAYEDRQMLLQVLPRIRKLSHFGYYGCSICPNTDNIYDTEVINVVSEMKELRIIYLKEINVKDKVVKFSNMSTFERIRLQQFEMNKVNWRTFADGISKMKTKCTVILNDTNIDDESFKKLQSSSDLNIVKDGSSAWLDFEKERKQNF